MRRNAEAAVVKTAHAVKPLAKPAVQLSAQRTVVISNH